MIRLLRGLLVVLAALCALASPAFAQTTAVPYTPGSGGNLGANTCGSYACPQYSQSFQTLPLSQSPGYFTMGTGTGAYNANQMLCNSTTGSTCNTMISSNWWVLPNGTMHLTGGTLKVNDTVTTSWAANSQISVDLWSVAPTIAAGVGNGDRLAYAIATGSASRLASLNCTTLLGVMGDGISFDCYVVGGPKDINLGSANAKIYGTFYTPTGSGVTTSTEQVSLTLLGTF